MKPEKGSVDLVGKSEKDMNMCWQTNGGYDCSLYIKIVGLTLLGGGPCSLCWAYVGTLGWKDVKHWE